MIFLVQTLQDESGLCDGATDTFNDGMSVMVFSFLHGFDGVR
jgi:hypothetical protein